VTEGAFTVRPLLITRIAMFALVALFLTVFFFEVNASPAPTAAAPAFESTFDVVSFVGFVAVLIWLSWRNWRLGVRLSASDVTVRGVFRDRTVARSAVIDIAPGSYLIWERPDGRTRTTPIVAFMDLDGRLAGFIVRHNERSLDRLRRQFPGSQTWEYSRNDTEEDRSYDPPTYLRPRRRVGPPRHSHGKRRWTDALLAVAMLAGHLVVTALALWLVIEPAMWLAGVTDTPGLLRLIYSSEPYSRDGAIDLLLPHTVLAGFTLVMTARLLYFIFRPTK
jgi:hypothetical protein